MTKKVIVFNGPPNSGKDTFCDYLLTQFENSAHVRFKDVLYEETAKHYKIDLEDFTDLATDRTTKEKILPLTGMTPRQMLIEVSENVIKPEKGQEYFGEALKDTILNGEYDYYFISDSGFVPELESIVETIDRENLILIKLEREGTSFNNDSRDYIPEEFIDKHFIQSAVLYNVGLEDSKKELLKIIQYFFKVNPNKG